MKVLKTGKSAGGVDIQIEEWSENYSFMPYGSRLALFPNCWATLIGGVAPGAGECVATHKGQFAPKAGESYRFSFEFPSNEEAEAAFTELESGNSTFTDYLKYWAGKPEYRDCI